MDSKSVIEQLQALADPQKVLYKQNKYAIKANRALGVYQKDLKTLAKEIGYNNSLALELFDSGIYEARLLCSKIYRPKDVTLQLMQEWTGSFENWEICDSFCMGLYTKYAVDNPEALTLALSWTEHPEEFIKRAGFVVLAAYGFADKQADNRLFKDFFRPIMREAMDERQYVKKAINWALRNIGKRNKDLNKAAIETAQEIVLIGETNNSKSARWVGKNALSEITKPHLKTLDYPRDKYRPI